MADAYILKLSTNVKSYINQEKLKLINEFQESNNNIALSVLCNNNAYSHKDIHDLAWEEIHTGPWSNVYIGWRHLFSWASVQMVLELINIDRSLLLNDELLQRRIVKILDMALLIGGPRAHDCIHDCINYVVKLRNNQLYDDNLVVKYITPQFRHTKLCKSELCSSVEYRQEINLIEFKNKFMKKEIPVIIDHILCSWPSFADRTRKWNNLSYLSRIMGLRVVPIEKGSNYMNHDWKQEVMVFDDFLNQYIYPHLKLQNKNEDNIKSSDIAYLAQHNIFEQIPELRKDIQIPDFCFLGEDSSVDINIWFGPPGTVSPLHYDPKHNILCQVVGCKLIRLYPPSQTKNLYPNHNQITYNTSRVDINNVNHDLFPLFANTSYFEVLLEEGQSLYIPPKWWHYVESKTISCSISFWFE